MKDLQKNSDSYTVRYLLGEETIPLPEHRRPWNNYIEIKGARENNLKGVEARFPLNVMTVVTGVSGSGKSTLVRDIFYRALKRELDECSERPGEFTSIGGDLQNLRNVEFVDQNPIGKSSRSNPVTYIKAYDEIRKLWADQPLAKQMGYSTGYFSFNSEGGRCEECKGEGTITVEMQFMADLVLECESCHGKRFKADTLEVKFHNMNIYDVLEMTVNQAIEFFTQHGQKKIVKKLQPLQDVGLGYIKLGQASSTLSGGENQRVKLAFYLSQEKADPTMFIFDEPTTGLHFHDIKKLLEAFDALIRRGHSIVIIEHNLDVVKCADHVIDLGRRRGQRRKHRSYRYTGGSGEVCGKLYGAVLAREITPLSSLNRTQRHGDTEILNSRKKNKTPCLRVFVLNLTGCHYSNLKVTGKVNSTFTALPCCIPGFHCGINPTIRNASSSKAGYLLRIITGSTTRPFSSITTLTITLP